MRVICRWMVALMKKIPVVLISDEAFVMPTSVAMTSVIKNRDENVFIDFYIVMPYITAQVKNQIKSVERAGDCAVNVVRASLDKYDGIKQMAHIPLACLLKFELAELIPEYDKVLYIDGDVIVRQDLWELYSIDIGNNYAAGVKDFAGIYNGKNDINAGILLFNTRRIREEKLLPVFVETRKKLGDKNSMDQTTFNMIFKDNVEYLEVKYNCIPEKIDNAKKDGLGIDVINNFYGLTYSSYDELYNDAVIIHYASGRKPWKYTYVKEAKEWYQYYKESPFFDKSFRLRGRFCFRVHKYYDLIRNNGIVSAWNEIKKNMK